MLAATHGEAKPRSAVLCPPLVASGPATAGSGDAGGGSPTPSSAPAWVPRVGKGSWGCSLHPIQLRPPPRPPPNGCAPVMNPIPLPSCHPLALANEQIDGTCGSHRPFPSFASLAGIYIWLEKSRFRVLLCFAGGRTEVLRGERGGCRRICLPEAPADGAAGSFVWDEDVLSSDG